MEFDNFGRRKKEEKICREGERIKQRRKENEKGWKEERESHEEKFKCNENEVRKDRMSIRELTEYKKEGGVKNKEEENKKRRDLEVEAENVI